MVSYWEPGTQYDFGDVVEYEHNTYKIIQPHRSQDDWTPDRTPALWGRMHRGHGSDRKPEENDSSKEWHEHKTQQVEIPQEDRKKKWYDLDDKKKKELEIGGGLLTGALLIGGGFAAYKHHQKAEEEKKADAWALQNWLHDAQQRTEEYHRNGSQGSVTWVLTHGKRIPSGAITGGNDQGHTLYIARAFQDGGVIPGKASDWFEKGAVIGYQEKEIQLDTYEILVGDKNKVKWVSVTGSLKVDSLGATPVEGGKENDETPLYIAQAPYGSNDPVDVHPGKVSETLDGAFIPYDGTEKKVKEYRVLCLKTEGSDEEVVTSFSKLQVSESEVPPDY